MSCCGQKRLQLAAQHQGQLALRESVPVVDKQPQAVHLPRIFEYIGCAMLTLRGAASGTNYSFSHHGACLEVRYEDSFAMLAEHDLKLKVQAAEGGGF
jgi:hypothetical protein